MGFPSRNVYHLRGNKTDNPAHLRTVGQQVAAGQARRSATCRPHDRVLEAVEQCLNGCHPHFKPDEYFPSFYPERKVPRTAAPDHLKRLGEWLDKTQRRYWRRLARGHGDSDGDHEAVSRMSKVKHTMWWLLQQERPQVSIEEYPGEKNEKLPGETYESSLETQESILEENPLEKTPAHPVETEESLTDEDDPEEFPIHYYYVSGGTFAWVLNQEDPANMEIQDPNILAPEFQPEWEVYRDDRYLEDRRLRRAERRCQEAERYHQARLAWEAKYYLPEGVRRIIR